jgi:streptogramin lyase
MSFDPFYITALSGPTGLTYDTSGNLYVANQTTNTISKITTGGVISIYNTSGVTITGPQYLAFNSSGDLYCSTSDDKIVKITTSGFASNFATASGGNLLSPKGLVFIGTNLYVACSGSGSIINIIDSFGNVGIFAIGFSTPQGLVYDGTANLYVTNSGATNNVNKIVVSTATVSLVVSLGFGSNSRGIAIDSSGNLYISRFKSSISVPDIVKITPDGSGKFFIYTSLYRSPTGLAFDSSGNLFVANQAGNNIYKIISSPVGTFSSISVFIGGLNSPKGIVFDTIGNLYVANGASNNNTISKITPGGTISIYATGAPNTTNNLFNIFGLAFKGTDLYCINTTTGPGAPAVINKITTGGTISTFTTFSLAVNPLILVLNPAGTFFYCSNSFGTIIQVDAITGTITNSTFATVTTPVGLVFDTIGNLYVASGTSIIKIIILSDIWISQSTFATVPNSFGLTFDLFGDLYSSSSSDSSISKITPIGSVTTPYTGLTSVQLITFNSSGHLYYDSSSNNNIYRTAAGSCFNEGTKILCIKNNEEVYIPIQDLRNGDEVKTYLHGNRKIKLIGKRKMINSKNIFKSMYIWRKSEENDLIEDLFITGAHSILLDELTEEDIINEKKFRKCKNIKSIDDKFLLLACSNKQFEQINDREVYTYYHLVLEDDNKFRNFGIWVNGILSETICEEFFLRHKFDLL